MTLINLTPHEIIFSDGRTIKSSGVARCKVLEEVVGKIDDLPIIVSKFGDVEGLPPPTESILYIVSMVTASACRHRKDVFVPARLIRDEKGNIVGCSALGRVE
jgi:hypothetical protein